MYVINVTLALVGNLSSGVVSPLAHGVFHRYSGLLNMNGHNHSMMPENAEKSSYNRLVDAVSDLWEQVGHDGISARLVASTAGVPVSVIYHHFGSMERLFFVAQEQLVHEAHHWCADRLQQLSGMPADPAAFAGFFSALVDDWAQGQRRLAFAWREGLRIGGRQVAGGGEPKADWAALWDRFWQQAAAHFGLEPVASIMHRIFENEAFLHMFVWRRAVDRAGLDEFARGLGAWLTGTAVPASPWRDFARTEARREIPDEPDYDAATAQIAAAAARMMEWGGPGAVTHRAVAEQAGLTLGVVSYKVRTKAELLQLAYGGFYADAVAKLRGQIALLPSDDPVATLNGLADFLAQPLRGRGIDSLHLAVIRDPALRQFGLQLRYLRGNTSRSLLQALLGGRREPGHLEAALLSSFISTLSRVHAHRTREVARELIRAEIAALIALL